MSPRKKPQGDKLPYLPLWVKDFYADGPVAVMTMAEEGCYFRLLCHQWLNGFIPDDVAQLAIICKNTPLAEFQVSWDRVLSGLFPPLEEGCQRHRLPYGKGRMNGRLERERTASLGVAKVRSKVGKMGATARWRNKLQQDGNSHPVASTKTVPETTPKSSHSESERTDTTKGDSRPAPARPLPPSDRPTPPAPLALDPADHITERQLQAHLPPDSHAYLRLVLMNAKQGAPAVALDLWQRLGLDPKAIPSGPGMTHATPAELGAVLKAVAKTKNVEWTDPLVNAVLVRVRRGLPEPQSPPDAGTASPAQKVLALGAARRHSARRRL